MLTGHVVTRRVLKSFVGDESMTFLVIEMQWLTATAELTNKFHFGYWGLKNQSQNDLELKSLIIPFLFRNV